MGILKLYQHLLQRFQKKLQAEMSLQYWISLLNLRAGEPENYVTKEQDGTTDYFLKVVVDKSQWLVIRGVSYYNRYALL